MAKGTDVIEIMDLKISWIIQMTEHIKNGRGKQKAWSEKREERRRK